MASGADRPAFPAPSMVETMDEDIAAYQRTALVAALRDRAAERDAAERRAADAARRAGALAATVRAVMSQWEMVRGAPASGVGAGRCARAPTVRTDRSLPVRCVRAHLRELKPPPENRG